MKKILLILFILFISLFANGVTRYVGKSGNDNNTGTFSSRYLTIQKAANVSAPGDLIIVGDGNYTAATTDVVAVSTSGTSGNYITYRSENKWGAQIYKTSTVRTVESGFSIAANYIIVEDFEVRDIVFWAMYVAPGAHHVEIRGCKVHHIGRVCSDIETEGYVGINLDECSDIIIEHNLIYDVGRLHPGEGSCSPAQPYWQNHDHGLYSLGTTRVRMNDNVVYNCWSGWCLHVFAYNGVPTTDLSVYNNTFGFPNSYRDGHILIEYAINVIIKNNLFYSPTNTGVNLLGVDARSTGTIQYNMAYGATVANTTSGFTISNNTNNTNPLIVSNSTSTPDFQLTSSSPAINGGVNVGLTVDYLNNPIVGLPDIGAYEYTSGGGGTNSKAWKQNLRIVSHKHPIVAHGKPIY